MLLQLQFQQALLALPGTESSVVAVAVPADPASSAREEGEVRAVAVAVPAGPVSSSSVKGQGCCSCSSGCQCLLKGWKFGIKFRLYPGACVRDPKALYLYPASQLTDAC